jgi:inner membrane protein
MATAFSHALVGGALAQFGPDEVPKIRLTLVLMVIAVLPDLDVLAFKLGIAYTHPLGHRGFSHSILFGFLIALVCVFFLVKRQRWFGKPWWIVYFLLVFSSVSHGFLDALTDAGKGIGFFIPFDNQRYFLPWRIIKTSPVDPTMFFSQRGLRIMGNEIKIVWLPVLVFSCGLQILFWWKRKRNKTLPAKGLETDCK